MNEHTYHQMNNDLEAGLTCLANLEAILADNGSETTIAALARSLYRYTQSGVSLSVMLHDGIWKHYNDLRDVTPDNVRALRVCAIVEGSDAEVTGSYFDLLAFDDVDECVRAFHEEVEGVDAEACALFDEEYEAD